MEQWEEELSITAVLLVMGLRLYHNYQQGFSSVQEFKTGFKLKMDFFGGGAGGIHLIF